ncbi:MAG: hypothetical protein ACFFE6_02525 [Candidatus Thorarchaeota archaeon]
MSGSLSRKRRRKVIRQRSKEEIRWYTKYFADIIHDKHENVMFPDSEYTALTSEQILRLTQGPGLRRKSHL